MLKKLIFMKPTPSSITHDYNSIETNLGTIPIVVFNMNKKGNLKDILSGKKIGTKVN